MLQCNEVANELNTSRVITAEDFEIMFWTETRELRDVFEQAKMNFTKCLRSFVKEHCADGNEEYFMSDYKLCIKRSLEEGRPTEEIDLLEMMVDLTISHRRHDEEQSEESEAA